MVSGGDRHAQALREEVAGVIAPLGLRLSPEKTRVVHIDEGFDFLGFHIQRRHKRGTQKQCVYTTPSKKAVQAIKDKVCHKTHRSTRHQSVAELITSLNRTLRGWANYFRHGVSKRVFSLLDDHAWWRIVGWIRAKHSRIGMKEFRRWFCDHGWRLAHDGVVLTGASSVAVTRYRYRGRRIPTTRTPNPTLAAPGAWRHARRVRRAGRGNGLAVRPAPRARFVTVPAAPAGNHFLVTSCHREGGSSCWNRPMTNRRSSSGSPRWISARPSWCAVCGSPTPRVVRGAWRRSRRTPR